MRCKFLVSFISLLAAQVFFVVFANAQTQQMRPVAPTILKPDTPTITTARPLIAGVSPNDTIVEITINGALAGNRITNNHPSGTGNFFFQIEQPLAGQTHVIEARSINISNQELKSEQSKSVTVTIIPFGAPTLLLDNTTTITRAFTSFKGVAHNNSRIHVYIDDMATETFGIGAHSSGAVGFSHILIKPLQNGEHTIYLKAEDESGRFSLSSTPKKIRIVDFPAPTILSPMTDERLTTEIPIVAGIAFNDSRVKIFMNGREDGEVIVKNTPSGIGTFTYATASPLPRGQLFTVMAKAYDTKGRISRESNRVDAFVAHYYIPPTLFAVSGKSATPLVTGVAHNDSTVAIFIDGVRDSTITPKNHSSGTLYFEARIQTPLMPGAHRISAQAFDAMKKPSQMSNAIVITYTPPVAPAAPQIEKPAPVQEETATDSAGTGGPAVGKDQEEEQPTPPKEEPSEGQVTTPDEGQAKTTTETQEEAQPEKEDDGDALAQGTGTNWPLFMGVLLLIILAIIFIMWYLGSKRRLLNDGIDRLFSEENEGETPPPSPSGPSLFTDTLELPKTIDQDEKRDEPSKSTTPASSHRADIPPPPPSI